MATRIRRQHAHVGFRHVGDTAGLVADFARLVAEDRQAGASRELALER